MLVERYWPAITWDFQHLLGVNALEFFSVPCRCGQCRSRHGDFGSRFVQRRSWDQFLIFYDTLLRWRGSYVLELFMNDPDVIDTQAALKDSEWSKPYRPGLFGWTNEVDALYHVADQVQAGRVRQPDDFKPYPRPVIPAERERKRRQLSRRDGGIDAALARGAARMRARNK